MVSFLWHILIFSIDVTESSKAWFADKMQRFGDLIKLDLGKKSTFMKLKDMSIGFSTMSTITKLKEIDQINNAQT